VTHRPSPTIRAGGVGHLYVEAESDISKYCTGKEWGTLKEGEQSDKYFNLVRADRDKPSPTICASHGSPGIASVTHPTERRKFSIAELKRICGFPDDFKLVGTYAQQWERCGRSVPPVMMSHIAAAVRDSILKKICAE
jgi:DNA (cytosine-5)-methyltransferase 1